MARHAQPSSKKPSTALYAATRDTVPNAFKISGIRMAAASGNANTAASARNLPATMAGMLTGLVSSSWSVLFLRSSAKLRMLMAGSRNNRIIVIVYSTAAKSGEA